MWQPVSVYNPRKNPYGMRDVPGFTHAARTPRQKRQWLHVYDSARAAGYDEGSAIAQASGVVGRNPKSIFGTTRKSKYQRRHKGRIHSDLMEYSRPVRKSILRHKRKLSGSKSYRSPGAPTFLTRKNQGITDALALKIADKVVKQVDGYLTPKRKRKATAKRKVRKNLRTQRRFVTKEGSPSSRMFARSGRAIGWHTLDRSQRKSVVRHRKKASKRKSIFNSRRKQNPALAVIGLNPKRKRRKTMAVRRRRRNLPKRNAKGRFVKVKSNPVRRRRRTTRRRRRNPVLNPRRRRHVRATPRRRRRRSNPVRTHRRRRTRVMAHRRRRRRKNPIVNPRRRRRATVRHRRRTRRHHNPVTRHHRRRRNRRYGRRRNAGGIGGFVSRIDWKAVLFVSGGVFIGDKLTGLVSDKIMSMASGVIGTSPTTAGFVKLAVGVLAAGLAWKFQPAFGLGIAVGATNALLNQYVFGPAWGYVAPTLGVSGLGDYVSRGWKQDNWIGQATGSNLQGMGNPLLSKGL